MNPSYHFEFVAELPATADVRVDESIFSRDELFERYAAALRFPDYFGMNWDAFIDSLSDLSWFDRAAVLVVHDGLPDLSESVLRAYLDCLQHVLQRMRTGHRPMLHFVFAERDRSRIDKLVEPPPG